MRVNNKTLIALLIFLGVMAVYIRTLQPVFNFDDSPETIACAYTLGIQHPPGYPLPTLIGKLFTFLPFANTGFKINLQAAFFGALSIVLLFFILGEVLKNKIKNEKLLLGVSTAGALMLAFSQTFWTQAISAKGGIYTLNACFVLLLIWIAFVWEIKKEMRLFYLFAFIYGIAVANHWESMAVVFPAFFVFMGLELLKEGYYKRLKFKNYLLFVLFSLPGIFMYYYLMVRANGGALLNWGNPVDLKQLVWVVTRAEYTEMEKVKNLGTIIKQLARIGKLITSEFGIIGTLLFIIGIKGTWETVKKQRTIFFVVLFIVVLSSITFYFNLKTEMLYIMDVFLIPAYLSMIFFISGGIAWLLSLCETKKINISAFVAVPVFMLLPAYGLVTNFEKCDKSAYYYAYDFGNNVIKSVDTPGALALLEGDYFVMPQMYFKNVAKKLDFCPATTIFLYTKWGIPNLKKECPGLNLNISNSLTLSQTLENIIGLNFKQREIYTSIFRDTLKAFYKQGDAYMAPSGVLMKLSFDKLATTKSAEAKLKLLSYRNVISEKLYMDAPTEFAISNYGATYVEMGDAFKNFGNSDKAMYYLEQAETIATSPNKAECISHLGIVYSTLGRYNEAINKYKDAVVLKPGLAEAWSNMAGCYNAIKEYDKAIEAGSKAIKEKPTLAETYNNMAVSYYYKGDKKTAIEYMEKAVQLNPTNEMVKNLEVMKGENK